MFPAANHLRQRFLIITLIEGTESVRVEDNGEEEEGEEETAEESGGHGVRTKERSRTSGNFLSSYAQ